MGQRTERSFTCILYPEFGSYKPCLKCYQIYHP